MTSQPDHELYELFIEGNEQAFDEIYNRYSLLIRKYIHRYAHKRRGLDVDDLCQMFWLHFAKLNNKTKPTKNFKNWMIASAVNRVLMHHRHINTEKQKINHTSVQLTSQHLAQTNETPSETQVAIREELHISLAALRKLRPKYRNIINDLILQSIPSRQYAQEKGLAHTRVPCELKYALRKLREVPEVRRLVAQS